MPAKSNLAGPRTTGGAGNDEAEIDGVPKTATADKVSNGLKDVVCPSRILVRQLT